MKNDYTRLWSLASGVSKPSALRKVRDLSLIDLVDNISLVIACDSNASNGEKPGDFKPNAYEEVAISALKVPVMEVLASGATPLVVANNLCVEMNPSGSRIIGYMKRELEACGLWDNIQFTGSTEDNMKTAQTGIGVTVIGLLSRDRMKIGKTRPYDIVACVGIPQSGIYEKYSEYDDSIAKIATVMELLKLEYVHEILPVGSKGVRYEARELANYVNCRFEEKAALPIDTTTSAGSSTAVLVSLNVEDFKFLQQDITVPIHEIGFILPVSG